MRSLLAVAASLLVAHAVRGESFTVRIQETAVVEIAGATAAYTTNPLIADVTASSGGRLTVTGHSSGTTQLIVITASGTQSFLIRVAAASIPSSTRPQAGAPVTRYEGRYSTATSRVQNAVDVVTTNGQRRSEFYILHIRDLNAVLDEQPDTIATVFYRHATPGREVTLLDEIVDVSRMTVSNTQVRGLHLRQGSLEIHGGYASSTMYDGLFLHADRRWVGGAGYSIGSPSTRWTPSVYGFFSQPDGTTARRGVVGALTVEHREADTLLVRGDLGVSRSVAASGEIRHVTSRGQLRAFLSIKPDNFPSLGLSDLSGTHASVDWSRQATRRFSIAAYGTFDRFDLLGLPQTIGFGSFALRYALAKHFSILAGGDVSEVRTPTTSIRTIGLPLGIAYDASHAGLAASYRLLDHSAASRRGDSLRLSARAGAGRFNANVWAERQRQAPTLDLIFSAEPGLELALLRLGISVRTPEDVARALRDNAALIDLGFITGINVDLTPRRVQAGFNVGWLGSGPRSDHIRLLGVYGLDNGIRTTRENLLATLTYSRRILAATDLFGSYSWWRTSFSAQQSTGASVDLGLRQQFTGLPSFLRRSGTIEGFVFLDSEMRGARGPGSEPLAEIAVTLDGTRTKKTDAKGAYAFHDVTPGTHRIAAQLPAAPRAFFTTPSHAEIKVPARVDFGLIWTAARIDGRIISDAGLGIQAAIFSAAAGNGPAISATSDAEGRFVFVVPPGTFRVALTSSSLPAGYSVAGEHTRSVTVEADRPQSMSFEVQALRSVAGRAAGAAEVRIESLGRTARVDSEGNFVFRSMPAGTFTLIARSGNSTVSQTVTLPPEPAMVRDVVLGASSAPGAFRVAVGAFRLPANAAAARLRIERLGGRTEMTRSGSLTLLTIGPFASREAAEAEAERLKKADVDAVIVGDRAQSPASPPGSDRHVIQAGAFRHPHNVTELIGRLQRAGEQPFTAASGGLTLVYIGPFATRHNAIAANERMRRAGFDGFVTRR